MRDSLLQGLKNVDWNAIARVYGCCHATLIGAVVTWWTQQGPEYSAFDGGPRHGVPGTPKAGQCDAILARGKVPEVILEVEGSDHRGRLQQIGHFLKSPKADLQDLRTGILVAYRTDVSASRPDASVDDTGLSELAKKMTAQSGFTGKTVIIVTIGKKWEADRSASPPLRERNNYYRSTLCDVSARQFLDGRVEGPVRYFPASAERAAST